MAKAHYHFQLNTGDSVHRVPLEILANLVMFASLKNMHDEITNQLNDITGKAITKLLKLV